MNYNADRNLMDHWKEKKLHGADLLYTQWKGVKYSPLVIQSMKVMLLHANLIQVQVEILDKKCT